MKEKYQNINFRRIIYTENDKKKYGDEIPFGVNKLVDRVFQYSKIKEINIPDSIVEIGKNCFINCQSLTSITISSRLTNIGERAFFNCNKLQSITLPSVSTSLNKGLFEYCNKLTTIEYLPFANQGMFKWKYMTHWTIDYGIKSRCYRDSKDMFYCTDGKKDVVLSPVNFSSADIKEFEKDRELYHRRGSGVVETSLDVWRGQWGYHIFRYDKPRPNHISVCIDTLQAMACNISKEELIYRCSVKPEEDHRGGLLKSEIQNEKTKLFSKHN